MPVIVTQRKRFQIRSWPSSELHKAFSVQVPDEDNPCMWLARLPLAVSSLIGSFLCSILRRSLLSLLGTRIDTAFATHGVTHVVTLADVVGTGESRQFFATSVLREWKLCDPPLIGASMRPNFGLHGVVIQHPKHRHRIRLEFPTLVFIQNCEVYAILLLLQLVLSPQLRQTEEN